MHQIDLEDRATIADHRCQEARWAYRDTLVSLGGATLLVAVIVWTYGAIFALFGLVPASLVVVAWRAHKARAAAINAMYEAHAALDRHVAEQREQVIDLVLLDSYFEKRARNDVPPEAAE